MLVLSRCAGAAEHLPEALIVNPFTPEDVARGLDCALSMSLDERRQRHQALLARVREHSVTAWGERFIRDLERSRAEGPPRLFLPRPASGNLGGLRR